MRYDKLQVERIRQMERRMHRVEKVVGHLTWVLNELEQSQDELSALAAYYGSDQWYDDLAADEKGRLPGDLKRGVLSEDLVYDMLTGNRDNAVRMLEIGTRIVKNG